MYTKGSWYYANGYVRARSKDQRKNGIILAATTCAETYEEQQANGRLMAAAPELYELVLDELRGEAGGILSFAREGKIRKIINRISGEETQA